MRGAWAAAAAGFSGALLVVAVLALSGFRGATRRESAGNYINDILVTSDGVYRFKPDGEGNTTSATNYAKPDFLEIYNGTAAEAQFVLYCKAGPGSADSVTVYVPTLAARSFPGAPIDSIRVTATFGGEHIILGGMD
jgi:hypothetical protein